MKKRYGRIYCDYAAKDVIIRWYAKDNPRRPGEIELLPWCKEYHESTLFMVQGPGGYCSYRDYVQEYLRDAVEPDEPRAWLFNVVLHLTADHGLNVADVRDCLIQIAEYQEGGYEGVRWVPEGGAA